MRIAMEPSQVALFVLLLCLYRAENISGKKLPVHNLPTGLSSTECINLWIRDGQLTLTTYRAVRFEVNNEERYPYSHAHT